MANTVQAVAASVIIQHPALGDAPIVIGGIKQEGIYVTSEQGIDNSKRIPLIDGTSAALTNVQQFGQITVTATPNGQGYLQGNLPAIAEKMRNFSDSVGGLLTISYNIGVAGSSRTFEYKFKDLTFVKAPQLILAGNDLPDYPATFSFSGVGYPEGYGF